jgi:hypothetical protein
MENSVFVSSRAFSLSTPTFLLSAPVENSEATWKKATKCNKQIDTFSKQHSSTIISLHQNQDKSIKHVVKMENGMGSPLAAKKLNVGKYPGWPMVKFMF